ncbi:ArsS family sensor histidine kinase [Sulfurimonas sp. HSL-1716]|uniref:ArsS family sensor histidine kinase n=1 Tax=Hydrocurvibacter sulfurireducens TaxID=3131937 RepID=UPI0031F89026
MKRHAVLLTVLFALSVTLISVSYIFWEFFQLNYKRYVNNIFNKHSIITQLFHEYQQNRSSLAIFEANLAIYNMSTISEKSSKEILKKGKILKEDGEKQIDSTIFFSKDMIYRQNVTSHMRTTMLQYKRSIYFYINSDTGTIMIIDNSLKPYKPWSLISAYVSIISIIIISFMLILQRLRPLIRLFQRIALFGEGNLNVSFKVKGSDEIAVIANELETARIKINSILEARTLFLRNIMHELKTPIAKGTIATQMLDSQKQRDRFTSIFGRLETIVNDFAMIEEVTSLTCKQEFSEYRLVDIIDGAIDMSMVDGVHVSVDVSASVKMNANYRLYTTAIKNMIDNAMKYSPDKHINIVMKEEELCFESNGEKLKHPLSFYIEPFSKESPSKNSFGLGLYLVDSILKAHKQVLAYEYEEGVNRFIFAKDV